MFAFTRSDVQRIAVSAAGALLFSAVCIGGAVAPASASAAAFQPAPAAMDAWRRDTARRIDSDIAPARSMRVAARQNAQIGVLVAADGHVFTPVLLQSSGSRTIDRTLLRRAAALKLAPLPGTRAAARQVVLRVSLRDDRFATVAWPTATQLAAR